MLSSTYEAKGGDHSVIQRNGQGRCGLLEGRISLGRYSSYKQGLILALLFYCD